MCLFFNLSLSMYMNMYINIIYIYINIFRKRRLKNHAKLAHSLWAPGLYACSWGFENRRVPTRPARKLQLPKNGGSKYLIWLVVSTHLKNICQIENLAQVGVKKNCLKPPSTLFFAKNEVYWGV